jgi:membrane-bound lytic murein transglycosylase F
VSDARRLARFYQDKSDEWYTVSGYLELLAEEEYSSHEVVKGGAYYGSRETIAYVNKVVRTYRNYRRKVARHLGSELYLDKK